MTDRDLEIERRLTALETESRDQIKLLEDLTETNQGLLLKMAKYEGRWGTLLMIICALWAVFAVFKDDIIGWFK